MYQFDIVILKLGSFFGVVYVCIHYSKMKRIKNTFKTGFSGFFTVTDFSLIQLRKHTQKRSAKLDARCEASEIQILPGDEFNRHDRCKTVTFRNLKGDKVTLNAFLLATHSIAQGTTNVSRVKPPGTGLKKSSAPPAGGRGLGAECIDSTFPKPWLRPSLDAGRAGLPARRARVWRMRPRTVWPGSRPPPAPPIWPPPRPHPSAACHSLVPVTSSAGPASLPAQWEVPALAGRTGGGA